MSDEKRETLNFKILDKEYQISSPVEEMERLQNSAIELNKRMLELKNNGGIVGMERIAVMAALNISYDLLKEKQQNAHQHDTVNQYVDRLKKRLDEALSKDNQLELPTD